MGSITNGVYTPSALTAQTSVTVTATSTGTPVTTGTTTVVVSPSTPPVAPAIVLGSSNATVAFGGSITFTITTLTGTPTPTVSCSVTTPGPCSVSGNTITYSIPNLATAPASFLGTLTVTATNSAGTANAMATVNLVASITSATISGAVDPQALFCARDVNCLVAPPIDIVGTGFFNGVTVPHTDLGGLIYNIVDSSHATVSLSLSTPTFRPGPFHIKMTEPGPGGGDSNVANFIFSGDLNSLVICGSDACLLDQAAHTVWKFKLSDGSADGSFNVGNSTYGIAFDPSTNYVITTGPTGFDVWDLDGTPTGIGGTNFQTPLSVSAAGGYLFGSEDQAGQVVSLQLTLNGTLVPLAVGNTPWTTGMLTLNNKLVGMVFDPGDVKFSVVPVPIPAQNPAPLWTLTLSDFMPLNLVVSPPNGGWPLVGSQTLAKAAILSWNDRKIDIIDLAAKAKTLTVSIPAANPHILQMAMDDSHNRVIVVTPVTTNETSAFIAVDLTTGTISILNATAPFYCTAFGVSTDGKQLLCGTSGGKFTLIANQ